MKCIFCETDTDGTEPVEHVLPESIGNERHVMKRGLVCGKCNNYFASKVEKPFLELPEIVAVRFHQHVPSKKGRIPQIKGILRPWNIVVEITSALEGQTVVRVPAERYDEIAASEEMSLVIMGENVLQSGPIVSRFVAKVAVEAFAQRIQDDANLLDEFFQRPELISIRRHARYGETPRWPVASRKIYDSNAIWRDPPDGNYQIVHEFDFIYTELLEAYFVLVLFGQEFVINMVGPELGGWYEWLLQHGGASPLHHGKNAGIDGASGTSQIAFNSPWVLEPMQ